MGNFDTTGITEEYTIYDRVVGTEKEPLSKWRSGKTRDGGRLYYTGRTVHIITDTDGLKFAGMSQCNPIDAFGKREGKRRARDRAFGAFLRWIHNYPSSRGLANIVIKTYKGKQINAWELREID